MGSFRGRGFASNIGPRSADGEEAKQIGKGPSRKQGEPVPLPHGRPQRGHFRSWTVFDEAGRDLRK